MNPKYVIDANVLFSAFISGKDIYRLLFSEYTFYLPDFAFWEIEKYKTRILRKTKLNELELKEFVITLLQKVIVIPNLLISETSLKQAYQLCRTIDEKDTVYIATAIELDVSMITNDKVLYEALKEKNFNRVLLLGNMMDQLLHPRRTLIPKQDG